MVHCRQYHAAAKNAQQLSQWKTALDNQAASLAPLLFVAPQVGTFDARYKWGANWQFGLNAEYRFIESAQAEADQQWTDALGLMQGAGQVLDAFAERWDQDLEHPDASQARVNYLRVDL
jgi:outer membrane receptor for Fe3+-dicitrate